MHDQSPASTAPVRRALRIAGRTIDAVELPGDAALPALVLLHEGLGSISSWRDFPSSLQRATGRRVIAFSRFGHGHSEPPPQPRTPAFFHEEALEVLPRVLHEFGESDPVLVGHSDGASIAVLHAARHAVAGLALLAPHVVVEAVTLEAIRHTRDAYLEGDLRKRLARHHDDPDAAFWGWCDVWLDPAFRSWTIESDAARVAAPTLLIQGADDPYGTLDQLDRIEARVRGPVTRRVVPGGHRLHREQPEAVVRVIAAFVDGLR